MKYSGGSAHLEFLLDYLGHFQPAQPALHIQWLPGDPGDSVLGHQPVPQVSPWAFRWDPWPGHSARTSPKTSAKRRYEKEKLGLDTVTDTNQHIPIKSNQQIPTDITDIKTIPINKFQEISKLLGTSTLTTGRSKEIRTFWKMGGCEHLRRYSLHLLRHKKNWPARSSFELRASWLLRTAVDRLLRCLVGCTSSFSRNSNPTQRLFWMVWNRAHQNLATEWELWRVKFAKPSMMVRYLLWSGSASLLWSLNLK